MSPDDPRHGTRAGYVAGCRSVECRDANRRWVKRYRLDASRNGGRTTVPIEAIRQHVLHLQQTMSLVAIGSASGTSSAQLSRLLQGAHTRMHAKTAAAILAVRPDANVGGHYVSSIGAQRRLQALVALGYSFEQLEPHFGGYGRANLRIVALGKRQWITSDTATKVKAVYDDLWKKPPVGANQQERGWVTRTKRRAAKLGWVGPLAWDDDTIDDPTTRPSGIITGDWDPAGYDESRVERRMLGDRTVRLHRGESVEVVRRMLADGLAQNEIRRRTGLKPERYMGEIRAEQQLEQEVVAA